MDLMEDEGLKKSVIDQMMGELDDETGKALKKGGPVKGVEISIIVSPKEGEEAKSGEEHQEPAGDECMDPECEDPLHDHTARDASTPKDESDYISQLLQKLG